MYPTAGAPRLRFVLVAALTMAVVTGCSRSPADGSADAGFARDMATHHAQAVDMGFLVRDRTRDEPLRALATDIIVTQSAQRGIFMAWLQQWGLPQASPGPRMAWMKNGGHMGAMGSGQPMTGSMSAHGAPAMPGSPRMIGMASETELDALRHAEGHDAEVLFLQLMIRHHEGGVLMAQDVLEQSHRNEVVTLARSVASSQTGEIKAMTTMLRDRGAEPLPTLLK